MNVSNDRIKSVEALEKMIIQVINEPKLFLQQVDCIAALQSQRKLSAYENLELNITPCALNTLKTNADKILGDGYFGLDKLRMQALDVLELAEKDDKKSNKTTKKGVLDLLKQKEKQVVLLQQQNMNLVLICQELKRLAQTYASRGDDSLKAACMKDMKRINSLLTISTPFDCL